jgi:hypothetical protein
MNQTQLAAVRSEAVRETVSSPRLTLFALPKPFTDKQTCINQTNAILSWQQLAPYVEVILFGDDAGIEHFADEHKLVYGGALRRNEYGTPLLSDAFARVHKISAAPLLMYANSDVIFSEELIEVAERILSDTRFRKSITFGQRMDVPVDRILDWAQADHRSWFENQIQSLGHRSPVVCKEYFLFTRGMYESIPDFAVGRGNWDNWMIYHARTRKFPVINASQTLRAVHQKHGYGHLKTSRMGCYVTCPEAKQNQRLAGGRHIISGSCGTWDMQADTIIENSRARWNGNFWRDFSAFMQMIVKMPFER